jgi:RNA polymerase sigma-70 factor (ECF subfamily)
MANHDSNPAPDQGTKGQFPPTLWSVVLAAGDSSSARAETALTQLCEAYWQPLYELLRRQGKSPADSQDAVQSFLAHLLTHHRLSQVHPAKGRFRSFLLASLRNFLVDEQRKHQAQKRGGTLTPLSLDLARAESQWACEPADPSPDPAQSFERRWALTVLERALSQLKAEYVTAGKSDRFECLESFLLGDSPDVSYAEAGQRLGMSEGAVKMAVLRFRQRGRELFRMEVSHTVHTEEDIDDEVRHLFSVLSA